MVENPNNPILNLDVQKMQSWITPAKLMYEGDKGYNQPFKLTNAWNEYTVTAENLCFSARKPDIASSLTSSVTFSQRPIIASRDERHILSSRTYSPASFKLVMVFDIFFYQAKT